MEDQFARQVGEAAADTFLQRIFQLYQNLIDFIPAEYQWIASLMILLALGAGLLKIVKHSFLLIIIFIILFPGLLPVLKNLFDSLAKLIIGIDTVNY